MKIFLSGQRSFGKAVLLALLQAGHTITGVAPAPQGKRVDKLAAAALKHGIPIVSDGERLVSDMIPDGTELIVSAHSHWIISQKCIDKCRHGGIGFHPSMLPRHRGQDAVRWTIHMGDAIAGGTVYRLEDKCDGGAILAQRPLFVKPGWDYHDLWRAIFPVGVRLLLETVDAIEHHRVTETEQDEDCATWEPSWDRPRLHRNELLQLAREGSANAEPAGDEYMRER